VARKTHHTRSSKEGYRRFLDDLEALDSVHYIVTHRPGAV